MSDLMCFSAQYKAWDGPVGPGLHRTLCLTHGSTRPTNAAGPLRISVFTPANTAPLIGRRGVFYAQGTIDFLEEGHTLRFKFNLNPKGYFPVDFGQQGLVNDPLTVIAHGTIVELKDCTFAPLVGSRLYVVAINQFDNVSSNKKKKIRQYFDME